MPREAFVREVGLRDGLQMAQTVLSTERKLAWCAAEAACGVREIEVTSFVPPSVIAQFVDSREVAAGALAMPNLNASALVPNLKGAIRAFEAGFSDVYYVISASEAHSKANVRRSVADAAEEFRLIVEERATRGLSERVRLTAGIATAFGCTIQGEVPVKNVYDLALQLAETGANEIMIADTVGYGGPAQVREIFTTVHRMLPDMPLSAHFHDTRGLGLANVAAAVEAGIRRFDTSLAGLGGCPFAPGATGNINTEDTVFLLESLGLSTGIDLERLLEVRREVETWLPGESFSGAIFRAGLPKTYSPKAHGS